MACSLASLHAAVAVYSCKNLQTFDLLLYAVLCCAVWCQDADWEYNEDAADDDLDQGASDEEGLADDPGYRKQLGGHLLGPAATHVAWRIAKFNSTDGRCRMAVVPRRAMSGRLSNSRLVSFNPTSSCITSPKSQHLPCAAFVPAQTATPHQRPCHQQPPLACR